MKLKADKNRPLNTLIYPNRQNDSEGVRRMHLLAKQEWNERYGSYIAREHRWQMIAYGCMIATVISITGCVIMATQNKIVPYIIQVDKLGDAVAVQRADVASVPNTQAIRAYLAHWIVNARSVYFDVTAQRQAIKEVYASINQRGPAMSTLNEYYKQNDPFQTAQDQQVTVQVASVLPISEKTYRIEWTEEHRGKDGQVLQRKQQQASISIDLDPPRDESLILINPLGIYINSFSWSERL